MNPTMIGLDLAKSVFQVHGVDPAGAVLEQRKLRRPQVEAYFRRLPPALVGLEACGGAHHWARRLTALGHQVRLLPPQYVKPYLKRNKTDARDAEAICEALARPTMRFVPVKTEQAQAAQGLHRVRDLLVRQRSQLGHALRGLLAEFGQVAAAGAAGAASLRAAIRAGEVAAPEALRPGLEALVRQWEGLDREIAALEARITREAKACPQARRLMGVPGVGPHLAHAVGASVPDPGRFASGRDFAAWLGLTPRQSTSADKIRSGAISKAGDGSLRRLFVLGAASLVASRRRAQRTGGGRPAPWLDGLLARRPAKVAIVAMAGKLARIVWALLTKGTEYRAGPRPA